MGLSFIRSSLRSGAVFSLYCTAHLPLSACSSFALLVPFLENTLYFYPLSSNKGKYLRCRNEFCCLWGIPASRFFICCEENTISILSAQMRILHNYHLKYPQLPTQHMRMHNPRTLCAHSTRTQNPNNHAYHAPHALL